MMRTAMRHRAYVSRNVDGARDPYGAYVPAKGDDSVTLPCYWQEQVARTSTSSGKLLAVRDDLLIVPRGADLQEEDTITRVEDLAGQVLLAGKRRVTAVVKRETHIEAVLEGYGG